LHGAHYNFLTFLKSPGTEHHEILLVSNRSNGSLLLETKTMGKTAEEREWQRTNDINARISALGETE